MTIEIRMITMTLTIIVSTAMLICAIKVDSRDGDVLDDGISVCSRSLLWH